MNLEFKPISWLDMAEIELNVMTRQCLAMLVSQKSFGILRQRMQGKN